MHPGLVDGTFQSFSDFYRQQYSVAYLGHLHQEVEPKREGRGLLLTRRVRVKSFQTQFDYIYIYAC